MRHALQTREHIQGSRAGEQHISIFHDIVRGEISTRFVGSCHISGTEL